MEFDWEFERDEFYGYERSGCYECADLGVEAPCEGCYEQERADLANDDAGFDF